MMQPTKIRTVEQLLDRTAIFDLLCQERLCRDNQMWEEMTDLYAEDSEVDLSWFKGSGKEFVEASRRQYTSGAGIGFHVLVPLRLWLEVDRALVDSYVQVNIRSSQNVGAHKEEDEYELCSHTRTFSRVRRVGDDWKMMSFKPIYIRDTLQPVYFDRPLDIDWDATRQISAAKRFLGWKASDRRGHTQMIGYDEKEKVAALLEGELAWVYGA